MIRFLNSTEKFETRKVWEEIFKEDSKSFLDYYYLEKNKDNHILAKFIDNEIVSMLNLNPFKILIKNEIFKTYYIVAVATLQNHRKKGYMAEILQDSIEFMYKEEIPFCFLRPAKEEIYLPFDFRYIYNHTYSELKNNNNLKEIKLNENLYEFLANFLNEFLAKKYNIFSLRDYSYISLLHKEVKSENGDIILLYENNKFLGCYIYWGNENKIIRGIFTEDKYLNVSNTKPLVMARIINLNSFFKNITSKNKDLTLILNITDNIIKENNGLFKLDINKNCSKISKTENIDFKNILNISIADLTSLFFGYKNILSFTENKDIINLFSNINFYNVFLDEEV